MPVLLFFVLLVVLIAAFGFWDTLAAIFGAVLLTVLVGAMAIALLGLGAVLLVKRKRGG